MSILKVANLQNISGVDVYTAKLFLNLNGTGVISTRGSGNVSSVTDAGTGYYGINIASSFFDVGYALVHSYSNEINGQHTVGFLSSPLTTGITLAYYSAANSAATADKNLVTVTATR